MLKKRFLIITLSHLILIQSAFAEISSSREKNWNDSIKKLESKEEQIRLDVVNSFGFFDDRRALPYLIKALDDNSVEVKKAAILALGNLGDKSAITALKKFLQESTLAWYAAFSLGVLGDEEILETLRSYLNDKNVTKRKFAAYAISCINSEAAIKILNTAITQEDSEELRKEIEKILKKSR